MPVFSLKDQNGKWFRSRDHIGNQPLVVFFYPKDFTPGCTAEACSFRDSYEEFTEAGALVIGISSDSEASHLRFVKRYRLPFVLLSDPRKEARRKFRVANRMLNLLPGRETFVIDRNGIVVMAFEGLQASGHVSRALKALEKL
jgi:peroxiredoxin Q/BCP